MEIRKIKKSEKNQMVTLRDYCFSKKYNNAKLLDYKYWTQISECIGLFDGDKLGGQLIILPLRMNLYGRDCRFGGIGFVGLYPEYRSGGYMKKIIIKSLETMRENGQLLSILGPFSISYYRKMGWEILYDVVSYEVNMSDFPRFDKILNLHFERFDFNNIDISNVKEIHNRAVQKNNGWMYRTEDWWKRLESREPDSMFAVFEKGYLRYNKEGTSFIINDFVFLDSETEKNLYNFISLHRSNFFVVKGVTSIDSSMSYRLSNTQAIRSLGNNVMARIVDVEKYISFLEKKIDSPLYIKVTDQLCSWNNKIFLLDKDNIEVVDILNIEDQDSWVKVDIATLSASILGYFKMNKMESLDLIRGSQSGKLLYEKLIPKDTTIMFEHF
ncbi:GNAT family N-acetyltransferase [Vagococcus sp. PNs007]|uniref:GNAT family N-acetyltransferase n=1 Tax=Vagococcus proximus TaxID=2991417 RepID=A0ABT5WYV4_9ENTE|nr:GNAT family N-acetyltransferase [Vagococcus proximus]MDF0478938.1 GNAT family N-acetyltransferase [Vagococcus proximus]